MKQRGHQDHLLGSPDGLPHTGISNLSSDMANHYATWRQGDTWARYLPPVFSPTALASGASVEAYTEWFFDAAVHGPPSHTELPHITGPAHVVGEHGLAIADLPDSYRALDDRQRANTPSPCRSSVPPPRPYVRRLDASSRFRTLLQLLSRGAKPVVLPSAADGGTRVRIRWTGGLAAQYESLSDAEVTTCDGHRGFLLELAAAFSRVPSFGNYKSGRPSLPRSGAHAPGSTSSTSASTRNQSSSLAACPSFL